MARVFRVWTRDEVYWVPATSGCQTKEEAIAKLGLTGGYQVSTQFTGDLTAQEYIAQQKAETAPTTPTPTTPTPTTPTTPPLAGVPTETTTEYKDWSYLVTVKDRIEQQVEAYNKANKTSFSIDREGIKEYLDKIGATEKTQGNILVVYDLWDSYQGYLDYYPTVNAPKPKDFADYLANMEQWTAQYSPSAIATQREREFDTWSRYARKYGDPDDWYPTDIDDFYANYEAAQEQLAKWQETAGVEEAEFTDEQVREWNDFKAYASASGEITDWFPVSIEDYYNNYDQAQQQLATWKERYGEEVAEQEEAEKYEISPAEKLRRQEEGYAESRYAAQERYRETPQYQPPFTQWMQGQEDFSGALQEFTEREYPSLRSEFQATQPPLTGYPTREGARAEKVRREQVWKGWLSGMTPEIEQRYWGQRPAERGERLWMQAPTMRTANW